MTDKISTTALAKQKNTDSKTLFNQLNQLGYIVRHNDKWQLTNTGLRFGGEYVDHKEFGSFIVWPSNLLIDTSISAGVRLTATQIGDKLGLNAKKINQILNELGWMNKEEDGWHLTDLGVQAGGEPREPKNASSQFIVWHDTILRDKNFRRSVSEFLGTDSDTVSTDKSFSSFQQKFSAKHRTSDGHYVCTKEEMLIDNWLYMAGLVHAYQRKLPIEEELYCNFYLPSGRVYIQLWDKTQTEISREAVLAIYHRYNFNIIELEKHDTDNLDNILPSALRTFGVKAY